MLNSRAELVERLGQAARQHAGQYGEQDGDHEGGEQQAAFKHRIFAQRDLQRLADQDGPAHAGIGPVASAGVTGDEFAIRPVFQRGAAEPVPGIAETRNVDLHLLELAGAEQDGAILAHDQDLHLVILLGRIQ